MPQRFLRPGLRNSARWNSVGLVAGKLYIGLLTLVDDFGQYEGRTSIIWSDCFTVWNEMHPNEQIDLAASCCALQQLSDAGMVEVFEGSTGKRYLQVLQWQERVRVGCRPKWTESGVDYMKLQQVAASCSKILPPSPPPPPSPSSLALRHTPPTSEQYRSRGHEVDKRGQNVESVDNVDIGGQKQSTEAEAYTPPSPLREGKRLHGIPKDHQEVIEYGKTLNPKMTEKICREFFDHYESQRKTGPSGEIFWTKTGGEILSHWKGKLPHFKGSEAFGQSGNGNVPRGTYQKSGTDKMIERAEREIDAIARDMKKNPI